MIEAHRAVDLEHLRGYHLPFSLSGNIWNQLEGSIWLFTVAVVSSDYLYPILHYADGWGVREKALVVRESG